MVFEIRLHGIGGQGVAAGADLIALSAMHDGLWAHSFPFFGTEIRGGRVTAFARISPVPIRDRSFIYNPDLIVVFSRYLLDENSLKRATEKTTILVNSTVTLEDLPVPQKGKLVVIDADGIAKEIPGCKMGNSVLLGAIVGLMPSLHLESLEIAFKEKFFSEAAKGNIAGARAGFQRVKDS